MLKGFGISKPHMLATTPQNNEYKLLSLNTDAWNQTGPSITSETSFYPKILRWLCMQQFMRILPKYYMKYQ